MRRETSFSELEECWNRKGRKLWKDASFEVRQQFINTLLRARCYATVDVVTLLKEVFSGRKEIAKNDLYNLARARGLAKDIVREVAKHLGYRSKKKGRRSHTVWYFENVDPNWRRYAVAIPESELKAASAAEPDPRLTRPMKFQSAEDDDWFNTDKQSQKEPVTEIDLSSL